MITIKYYVGLYKRVYPLYLNNYFKNLHYALFYEIQKSVAFLMYCNIMEQVIIYQLSV